MISSIASGRMLLLLLLSLITVDWLRGATVDIPLGGPFSGAYRTFDPASSAVTHFVVKKNWRVWRLSWPVGTVTTYQDTTTVYQQDGSPWSEWSTDYRYRRFHRLSDQVTVDRFLMEGQVYPVMALVLEDVMDPELIDIAEVKRTSTSLIRDVTGAMFAVDAYDLYGFGVDMQTEYTYLYNVVSPLVADMVEDGANEPRTGQTNCLWLRTETVAQEGPGMNVRRLRETWIKEGVGIVADEYWTYELPEDGPSWLSSHRLMLATDVGPFHASARTITIHGAGLPDQMTLFWRHILPDGSASYGPGQVTTFSGLRGELDYLLVPRVVFVADN